MRFDIVIVTYNSEKWLYGCVRSLAECCYELKWLNLIFVDNGSSDNTVLILNNLKKEFSDFGGFNIFENKKNVGFGTACNIGASRGCAPFLFFLNADTEVYPDVFTELDLAIESHKEEAAAFECRQLPYEMGHHFNPVTLETSWASGAALIVNREKFNAIQGFDERFFMYCEDVDLSWRIRANGGKIFYVPGAVVNHYVLDRTQNKNSLLREYALTKLGSLYLAWKFAGAKQITLALLNYIKTIINPKHFTNVRRVLLKNFITHLTKFFPFWLWRFSHKRKNIPFVLGEEYCPERRRAILKKRLNDGPMISVVVRTCNKTYTLRDTLKTLRNQTYKNFEIIVVEDGPALSQSMIEIEFSDLPIRYISTTINQGRGKAGNLGLSMSRGEYCNFLDDDDFFYPDHLELMADKALSNPDADLILGCAMVMKIDRTPENCSCDNYKELYSMRFDRLDLMSMSLTCQIPIQSAIFKKDLFDKYGGLREDLNGNEDWTMWMKYLAHAKRIDNKHVDIDRESSIFVLPASNKLSEERLLKYKSDNEAFYNDKNLNFNVSLKDMREYYRGIIADVEHVWRTGQIEQYINDTKKRLDE